jgi:hypothetical protein
MAIDTGNTNRPKQPLCIADLCQAIGNGQIVPVVRDGCYQISSQDLSKVSRTEEAEELLNLLNAAAAAPTFIGAMASASQPSQSEVSCLA